MHKATPITQKASALKQTYNEALVQGARDSADKFKSYRADKTEKPAENENKEEEINPEVKIVETDDNTNPNTDIDSDDNDTDPNSSNGTASGQGGKDGEETEDAATTAINTKAVDDLNKAINSQFANITNIKL